jgi:hypothetical protein
MTFYKYEDIAGCQSEQVTGWQNLGRYETMIERQLYKAIHELDRIQRIRRGENVPASLAIGVDVSPRT